MISDCNVQYFGAKLCQSISVAMYSPLFDSRIVARRLVCEDIQQQIEISIDRGKVGERRHGGMKGRLTAADMLLDSLYMCSVRPTRSKTSASHPSSTRV